jgi:hypothetical protein
MSHAAKSTYYGLMAEFDSPEQIVAAARRAREAGYRKMEAYSPLPMEELSHAMGIHHSLVPYIVLVGGICGALGGFALCYWTSAIAYPMNIGGRPLNSWPAFIPVTLRVHDPGGVAVGGARHAGAERLAASAPSGVQRRALLAGVSRPLLPVHPGRGPEVRPRRDA